MSCLRQLKCLKFPWRPTAIMSHLSEKDWLKHKDTHFKVTENFFFGNTFSGPQRVIGASDVHAPGTLLTENTQADRWEKLSPGSCHISA